MWLLVLALVGVPQIARAIAHVWFVHRRHVLDHAVPDELPLTAREWLDGQLRAQQLADRVRVVVTDHVEASKDAFHVERGVIQLTAETSYKRDPVYWAIAAHELGHARFRITHAWSRPVSIAAFVIKAALLRFGFGLVVGNLLFAMPGVTRAAHWMLGASLVLHLVVLFDELVATRWALRALRAEPAFTALHLRAARSTLTAAFLTYLAPFVSYAVLFSQWWLVEGVTTVARAPSGGVTMVGYVGVALASAYILLYGAAHLLGALRAPKILDINSGLLTLVWTLSVLALIWVGWDRHATVAHAWFVLLACSAVQHVAIIIVCVPSSIALLPLTRWAQRFDRGIELSPAFAEARLAGADITKHGNRWLLQSVLDRSAPVSAARRIWELTKLAVFPLLLAFWL